ncbi:putative glycosyltransferase EpsJ [Clostridium tepidiprofundi DSM 19306]|uniref:Putative glycosyltransferase EpsJ n=1 Tax=Clostridium tepidiprofundi DSM 19306 TaxID=1121338 RepID=A0A151ASV4_9CLOT|nr:glycosyltransferase family 2 protein [Clostridium tepidiprofundi]KYH30672.1 putative glycosyltransferase EpsJ [Clostridium tepidiprofundi DSM 19306]
MKSSIIIPNYNGEKYIKECIDSLYTQTFKDFEIIIVDNASIDNSCSIIESSYPEIKLIKNNENYGFSTAVNQGIKSAEGQFVVLLNNDTVVDEYWLENLVNCIDKDDKIFSVCSKMIRYNEKDKIDDAGDEYCILGWAYKRGDGRPVYNYNKNKLVFSSCAGAAIYRKSVFKEIGYFDENFFAYLEDVDISYRAKIHGYKNKFCSKAKVYHIGSATTGSKYNSFKVKLASRNNIYLVYKNMPIVQLIINFPFLLIGYVIKLLFFIFKGYGKIYLGGTKEAFKSLKMINKTKFRVKNVINYFRIEIELIKNFLKYVLFKLKLDNSN